MAPPSSPPDARPRSRIPVRSPPASPPQRNLDHAQPGSQPMRHETELIVFFPLPSCFNCTEEGCSTSYSPAVWTSRRQSLQRHLEQQHGIRIITNTHFCTLCRKILGYRPTSHGCLTGGQHEVTTRTEHQHKCTECPYSFPSRKGLDNHLKAHRRRAAVQQASSRNQPASPTTSNDSNVDSLLSGTTTTPASTREPTPVSTPGTSRRGSPLTMTITPQLTEAASPLFQKATRLTHRLSPLPRCSRRVPIRTRHMTCRRAAQLPPFPKRRCRLQPPNTVTPPLKKLSSFLSQAR